MGAVCTVASASPADDCHVQEIFGLAHIKEAVLPQSYIRYPICILKYLFSRYLIISASKLLSDQAQQGRDQ